MNFIRQTKIVIIVKYTEAIVSSIIIFFKMATPKFSYRF